MAEEDPRWVQGAAEMSRMYGDLAERGRVWMTAALVSMGCSAVLAAGLVYITVTYDPAPYLVEVDALGETRMVNQLATQDVPERVQQATLRRVLVNMRQVPMDREILRAQHNIALAYLAGNAARAFNQDLARESDRLNRMLQAGQRRYVRAVQSVLPFPGQPGFYRVSWVEETLTGQVTQTAYEGHFRVVVAPVENPEILAENPMGIFVTEYSISQLTSDTEE